jgi:hypothetical protein
MRKTGWLIEEGTHPLCRVILNLELDACALACNQHASEDTGLHPDLATFTNNKALRGGPRVKIESIPLFPSGIDAARAALEHVDRALVGDEPVLIFPGDANRGADLVSYSGKSVSKIDGRRGGWWERETKEEGRKSTPGAVVMCE